MFSVVTIVYSANINIYINIYFENNLLRSLFITHYLLT